MLTISDVRHDRHCQGFSRREFLRIGGLALGGLTLADLLRLRSGASPGDRDRAVVLLFLQGGPPQTETFDPKMTSPAGTRSATGEAATRLPGVTFGGTFGRLAARADRLAVVRSYGSRNGGHTYNEVLSAGGRAGAQPRPTVSAMYARLAGPHHPGTGFPRNLLILPEAVQEGLRLRGNFETGALPGLTAAGGLGRQCEAFNPVGGAELRRSMELHIPAQRFEDRRALLASFDRLQRDLDNRGLLETADRHRQQAFDIIRRGITEAFDLSREDPRTVARYDTGSLFRMEDWTRYENMRRSTNLLGKQLLLARRLVEAGAGFVTVSDCGWDLHADGNSAPALTAMTPLGGQVDHAVSAFLDDLRDRGLSDRVLLVITGEMGRTPRVNGNGGRDHWGNLTPLVFAGGGLRMGQVIGRSDSRAGDAATQPYTPANLLATILHYLFDTTRLRLRTDLPREIKDVIENSTPIGGLF